MTGMFGEIYHNRVLELAADIPNVGALAGDFGTAEKVSRVCGSVVAVDIALDASGEVITAIAIRPKACALGQATAAVLAENAVGARVGEIAAAREEMLAMLKEGGPPPAGRFWELRHLSGVRDYPARHASTLLAFDAAIAAIEDALVKRIPLPNAG